MNLLLKIQRIWNVACYIFGYIYFRRTQLSRSRLGKPVKIYEVIRRSRSNLRFKILCKLAVRTAGNEWISCRLQNKGPVFLLRQAALGRIKNLHNPHLGQPLWPENC